MGEPCGLSNSEAKELCQAPDPATKVISRSSGHLGYIYGTGNTVVISLPGLSLPTNHVQDQGPKSDIAILHRSSWNDTPDQVGLSGDEVYPLFPRVSLTLSVLLPPRIHKNSPLFDFRYENPSEVPTNASERNRWALSRKATLELTHNWGTETDPDQKYHNGNSDPRGYGHIGVLVPDVYEACARFERLGVEFVKKPDDGKMKGLAFIKDPDGYWIEIFNPHKMPSI